MNILFTIIKHTMYQKIKSPQFILSFLSVTLVPIIAIIGINVFTLNNTDSFKETIYMTFKDKKLEKFLEKQNFNVIHTKQHDNNRNNNTIVHKSNDTIEIYNDNDYSNLTTVIRSYIIMQNHNLDIKEFNNIKVENIQKRSIDFKKIIPIYLVSFFIFFVLILYSSHMSYDIAQERSSGITEIILTNVEPEIHLLGKIISILFLSFLQLLFLVLIIMGLIFHFDYLVDSSDYFNKTFLDYIYIFIMIIINLVGLLSLSAFGGSLINDLKNISLINNFLLLISFVGFLISTIYIFVPINIFSIIISYIPLLNIYQIVVRIFISKIDLWEYITLFTTNLIYSVFFIYLASKYYKYSSLINVNDLSEVPKKIKILKGGRNE